MPRQAWGVVGEKGKVQEGGCLSNVLGKGKGVGTREGGLWGLEKAMGRNFEQWQRGVWGWGRLGSC